MASEAESTPARGDVPVTREEYDNLVLAVMAYKTVVPPGHFYSPIPLLEDIKSREQSVFEPDLTAFDGVKLDLAAQTALVDQLAAYYEEFQYTYQRLDNLRFALDNTFYGGSDAVFLYAMLRHLRPRRVIEIGSGHSSALILDVNELFFERAIACTFIEPYPTRLNALLRGDDTRQSKILDCPLHEVDLAVFRTLEAGDILFIDSTHVSKVGSDVNRIFFEILPALASGVVIHFHDIFYPFEYPRAWVYQGIAWNEIYILRAFLQYNEAFSVTLFNSYVMHHMRDALVARMPLCAPGGGSLWMTKR